MDKKKRFCLPDSEKCTQGILSDISCSISVLHHLVHGGHLHCCYMKLLAILGTEKKREKKKDLKQYDQHFIKRSSKPEAQKITS